MYRLLGINSTTIGLFILEIVLVLAFLSSHRSRDNK